MVRKSLAIGIAVVLYGGGQVSAQEAASVAGVVTDQSKGALLAVTVTATEVSSGRQYVAVTDERGQYRLANLQPGTYLLQGERSGFATMFNPHLQLPRGRPPTA